jgi:threonine dehydratase
LLAARSSELAALPGASTIVTLEDIQQARALLNGITVHTPAVDVTAQIADTGETRRLFLKLENLQPIGAFKLRGAYNKIASLTPEERRRGVIAYSSGNHAQGVAYAARALDTKAVIVMPGNAPAIKLDATASLGAEIVKVGSGSQERQRKAEELAARHGYAIVPPYNDEKIISGQGTMGLEILEQVPDVETVLVPVGGGGMISGVAAAIKLTRPSVKVIGVEPALAADAQASLRSGKVVNLAAEEVTRTMADGLRTQSIGDINFEHIRKFVDDIVTVSEEKSGRRPVACRRIRGRWRNRAWPCRSLGSYFVGRNCRARRCMWRSSAVAISRRRC